jgi:transcriptional regulator with XRE-family HTH domain
MTVRIRTVKLTLHSAKELGPVLRAVRKAQNLRQDDTAGSVQVSENFLAKVERGSESVQWGLLFRVLNDLGVRIELDIPEIAADRVRLITGGDA